MRDEANGHCSLLGPEYGPLFTYDWPGLREYYIESVPDEKNASLTWCKATLEGEVMKNYGKGPQSEGLPVGGNGFPMI